MKNSKQNTYAKFVVDEVLYDKIVLKNGALALDALTTINKKNSKSSMPTIETLKERVGLRKMFKELVGIGDVSLFASFKMSGYSEKDIEKAYSSRINDYVNTFTFDNKIFKPFEDNVIGKNEFIRYISRMSALADSQKNNTVSNTEIAEAMEYVKEDCLSNLQPRFNATKENMESLEK